MNGRSRRPLWLLDVDGVLNAVTRTPDRAVWHDWVQGSAKADDRRWPITFSRSVACAVARLHETGAAEVRWLTTWGDAANEELGDLLGLPTLEVVGRFRDHNVRGRAVPGDASAATDRRARPSHAAAAGAAARDELTGHWWKFDVMREILTADPDRAIVWTDDDLVVFPAEAMWLLERADCLLIAPDTEIGLTPEDLRRIEEFCRSHVS